MSDRETDRVEAFSDGVFAIAITLLGITLEVPDASTEDLLSALAEQWPSFLAFGTSFVSIGIIWVNHHRLFTHVQWVTHGLLLLNGLLLMTVVLTPFNTNLIAKHIGRLGARDAAVIYAMNLVLVTGTFNLLWRCATRTPGVVDERLTGRAVRRINAQFGFGPLLLYLVSAGVAMFSALASVLVDIALAVFFALPAFAFNDAPRRTRGLERGEAASRSTVQHEHPDELGAPHRPRRERSSSGSSNPSALSS